MRLIDADELIKRIGKWMPKDPCGKEQMEYLKEWNDRQGNRRGD